LQTK
jgi:hypothetical protein